MTHHRHERREDESEEEFLARLELFVSGAFNEEITSTLATI